jgi:hypothetical protein
VKWLAYIALDAVAIGIFIVLTHPIDLRHRRWMRIALSLPSVTFVAQILISHGLPGSSLGGMALVMWLLANIGVLGLLWAGPVADIVAHAAVGLLEQKFHEARLTPADFSLARRLRQEGEIKEAVAAAREELLKDASNYEGLILLAQLYEDLNLPGEALKQLDIILANPQATDAQKEEARVEKKASSRLADYNQIIEMNRKHKE